MAVSSRQKSQKLIIEERIDHLLSCIYRMDVLGDGCRHWNEETKKEISGGRGVNGTETEAGIFVLYASFNR